MTSPSGQNLDVGQKFISPKRLPPLVRTMKISARNILKGKVKKITPGAVNSEVVVELPGGQEVTSIITKTSVASLGLAVGKPCYAVIKSSEVMIAVD